MHIRSNLIASATSFVGRSSDLASIAARIDEGARLVTILGPGGMGKTRLALRFVETRAAAYEGGAWLCDLTRAQTVGDACAVIASALGMRLAKTAPLAALGRALALRGRILVLLDNFESLAEHAEATVGALVRMAPRAVLLVTSRVALEVAGEHLCPLEPLGGEDGVRLFVARAREVRPSFSASGPELAKIADIVRRVEGIPLAIELAAARVAVLSPAQIAARLSPSLPLLVRPGREGRHASMRETIADSYAMLGESTRACFAATGVFHGGFSLEAAEYVLGGPAVLDAIEVLRARSLLHVGVGDEGALRFALYEPIREFAVEQLTDDSARRRHKAYFVGLGRLPDARLALDFDNLVAAHETAMASGDAEASLTLALMLDPILRTRGHFAERLRILETTLAIATLRDARYAEALVLRGHAECELGQVAEARDCFESALSLAESLGSRPIAAQALVRLGELVEVQGATDQARQLFARAIATGGYEAEARIHLAHALRREGRLDDAERECARAIALFRGAGEVEGLGNALYESGVVALFRERHDLAAAAFDDARAIARRASIRPLEGSVQAARGTLLQEVGALDEAIVCHSEALAIAREVGSPYAEGTALYYLAGAYLERGQHADAEVLLQRALTRVTDVGSHRYEALVRGLLAVIAGWAHDQETARAHLDGGKMAASACVSEPSIAATIAIHAAHVGGDLLETARAFGKPHACDDPRFALRVFARAQVRVAPTLIVRSDGSAFRVPGADRDVDLSRRAPLRRILVALAGRRRNAPGDAVGLDEIVLVGWPGERMGHAAGVNRTHVALAELRKLGLRDILVTLPNGYALTTACDVRMT